MNDHTPDCRIHDDGSCCDCGFVAAADPTGCLAIKAKAWHNPAPEAEPE